MTDDAARGTSGRYDRLAQGYATWWGPVIAPAALAVLDAADGRIQGETTRILDLGTGTGTLALEAVRRWPAAHVSGIDPSDGMLDVARAAASTRPRVERDRLDFRQAFADTLPYPDGSFDAVVSSFVLQLVPSRFRALGEARRVLRPGGRIAFITWLASRNDRPFAPDTVFDAVLDEFGIDPGDDGRGADDIASPAAAEAQLRRAGFRAVRATEGLLSHAYDPAGYVEFLWRFDEEDLFMSLDDDERDRLTARLLERLRALPPDDLVLRLPTVLVEGVRS